MASTTQTVIILFYDYLKMPFYIRFVQIRVKHFVVGSLKFLNVEQSRPPPHLPTHTHTFSGVGFPT